MSLFLPLSASVEINVEKCLLTRFDVRVHFMGMMCCFVAFSKSCAPLSLFIVKAMVSLVHVVPNLYKGAPD